MIDPKKIIIALDNLNHNEVDSLLKSLEGHAIWVKIGIELFYNEGKDIIYKANDLGFKIFLDLKMHDIPHTVTSAMKIITQYPIHMTNVHAAGGLVMMTEAMKVVLDSKTKPLLIAVTQLTSTTESMMQNEQKIPLTINESVLNYAKLSKESGLDGIVCSAHEVKIIKENLGPKFLAITPGIRPVGSSKNDQARVTTPLEAMNLGVDYIVIGRPITKHPNPKLALEKIIRNEEI